MIASKGGASETLNTLFTGKAGGTVTVRRTLASTICRIVDPTQVPRLRQLRDASTVMPAAKTAATVLLSAISGLPDRICAVAVSAPPRPAGRRDRVRTNRPDPISRSKPGLA